jgi:hypothetical protein
VADVTRTLWKVLAAVVAVPVLVMGSYQVATALAHDTRTVDEEVPAEGASVLDVDNDAGDIRIVGVEGATSVRVHARISDGWRATTHDLRVEGDRLVLRASCPIFGSDYCEVDYTIEVPTDLRVEARGEQRISVTDLASDVYVESDASRIDVARVTGDVTVRSDQGRIEATELTSDHVDAGADQGSVLLSFEAPPRSIVAEADQGSIEIVLPKVPGIAYASDAGADQGSVTELIDEAPDGDRTISAHADQGDVTVRYR